MRVMLVVTHLLGSGHLVRAATLGRAFARAGHSVTLVSGGMALPHLDLSGLELVQLPPVRVEGTRFTQLLDAEGKPVTEAFMQRRRASLVSALENSISDVVITELFPFGRRVLAGEFQALLHAAQAQSPRPLLCASIRDILAPPSRPDKAQATSDLVEKVYDAVLVHADPDVISLEASWPVTPQIADKLHYTGFVTDPETTAAQTGASRGGILVTSGGGPVGFELFETAVQAAARRLDLHWHLLIGGTDAAEKLAQLALLAGSNVTLGPTSPLYRGMLHEAAASISFCGYNTALDVLKTSVPAVFVPFDADGETEQSTRAEAMSHLAGIEVVRSADLSPDTLCAALARAMQAPARPPRQRGFDGARQSVAMVEHLWAGIAP